MLVIRKGWKFQELIGHNKTTINVARQDIPVSRILSEAIKERISFVRLKNGALVQVDSNALKGNWS